MEGLYFIAVVPPVDIRDQVTEIKKEISEKYASKHALKSPPHITLHMPFKLKEKKLEFLQEELNDLSKSIDPFQLRLVDFDFFEPRVVFIYVEPSEELFQLQKNVKSRMRLKMNILNADRKDQAFHPHMTVAFRDLKKPAFYEAKKEFEKRKISFEFQVDSVFLLKHNGRTWDLFRQFSF